jgi:hypothetical protein
MSKIKINMKYRNLKKFLCGLGGLRETIWFPSLGDSPPQADARGAEPLREGIPKGDSLLLVLVALMVFCLDFLMVPAAQACAACGAPGGLEHMIFWARVVVTGGLGIVIAVLGLAFVMRRRTKKDK